MTRWSKKDKNYKPAITSIAEYDDELKKSYCTTYGYVIKEPMLSYREKLNAVRGRHLITVRVCTGLRV